MDSTRSTTSMFPQSAIVGLVALSIVVLSLAIVGQTGILPFTLTTDSSAQAVPAVRNIASANAEGLATYFESERGLSPLALPSAAGLAAYHESEWTAAVEPLSFRAGLGIYRDSERNAFSNPVAFFNAEGMAIYRASEHAGSSHEQALLGREIYRSSEQGR